LQNAQSFARNQQRISELALINEAAREITANLDVDQICELLYQQSQRLFDNDLLLLGLYDAEQQMINLIYYRERANEAGREAVAGFPFGQGLSSRVIAERRPLLIKNLDDTTETGLEPGTNLIGSHMEQLTKSWLGVPLLRGDEVIGVLNIQSYKTDAFSEDHIPLLGTLASQTVVALQNAQLFQRNELRINELAALSDLGRELTSQLDVAQIGRTIYESIKDSFPLDAYFILLYDERRDTGFCPIYVDDGEVGHDERPTPLANSLSSYVIQQRKPLLIADLNDPTILPEGKQPQAAGKDIPIRSWLGVPMIIGSRILGVIGVQSYNVNAYSNNELQFLSTVASQASVAIENAYLFEQYKQRINELNSLNQLTRSVTASMHVDAVAISVYDHIKKFVDLDVFTLALYNEEHNLISWPFVAEGGERITDVSPQPLGLGVSSLVIESQKPLVVQDLLDSDSMPELVTPLHFGSSRRARSWAGAPMMAGRQVIGVISVQAYEPGQYDQEVIRPLLSVANQAAIAIQNAKLFEERERKIAELATINQMAKEISSSLQLDELLQLIYNQITQVMITRNFLITLYDERRQEIQYRFMREHGHSVIKPPRKLGPGFISQIIESRQPLLINYDTGRYADERGWEHIGEPARSWLGVPMTSGDQVLGVIVVQSYETEGAYDVDDLSLLSTIASQAAVAIEKAKLFEEAQSRVLQLDTLNEIGRILGAVLDEETVFQKIFEHTTRFFDELSGFYIGLYQREQGMITFPFAVEDEQRIEITPLPLGEGLTSYVIANRRALLIDDLEVMAREYGGYHAVTAGKTGGERSWMGVPLFLGGEVIGLISLQSRKPNAYRQEDLQFLATLANQAAVAIKNAKLFDEIREFNATLNRTVAERTEALGRANQELRIEKERISQLYEITHQLTTSLDLEEILSHGLQLVANSVGVERGSIMTINPTTTDLVYRAVLGDDKGNRIGLRTPWQPGQGAAGWAVANRMPLLISDTNADQRWVEEEDIGSGVGSVISVPLMSGSDVFGVLSLLSKQPNFFNESHLRLVSTVANEMAVFAHNAELYSYISEQAEALASSLIVQEQDASRSRAILESIADGVLAFDSEDRITLVNPAAEVILGVSGEMLMNRHVPHDLRNLELGPELLDLVQSVVNAAHEGARGALILSRRRFSMNGRVISVSLSPVATSKHETLGLVAVLRDITREVEIEREKSDFVSTVSHELRTPMTVIKGHTDLLLAGAVGALSPMQGNFLQAVKRNTDRMNTLVSDLLTVSRIETGRMAISMQPNYYEVGELMDSGMQTLRSLAEAKNQQLILNVATELPEVLIDRDRTIQVLTNLISNSIKYTPNNGRIEVNVVCAEGGEEVQVDVADNGIGIAEKDQEKLFQPFYRSDNAEAKMQEGTGLGLVIAKSLVELQGGRLWLKSKPGEGTSFSFTMPAYKEKLETTSVQVGEDGWHGKARILVVDDDPQVANALAAALEHEGYATLVAYSGRKAIEIASAQRLDLITMDIVMPEMDGFETMKALSDDPNSAGVPILIISLIAKSQQSFALGVVGYLTKPVSHDALIRSVEQALAARTTRHEGPARILIIDDEHDIVTSLETALRQEGFSVNGAFSGEEGLDRIGEYNPDVILLDMRMPGINGIDVLTTLKHTPATHNIPVIILTASEASMNEARVRVIGLGAQEMLTKPFSIYAIVNEIKKVIGDENKDELDG
jgi:PAS domain S-box-containing protein